MRSNTAPAATRRRSIVTRLAAVAAMASLFTGCMMFSGAPTDLDYSRTRTSEAGIYRGTILPQGDSIPKGRLQRWTLHLETAAGVAVDSASIQVDGGMPQHGHGLPTRPAVTGHPGNGDHTIDGMKFNMGGWWVVKFRVSSPAGSDSLVFNLKL